MPERSETVTKRDQLTLREDMIEINLNRIHKRVEEIMLILADLKMLRNKNE